MANKAPTKVKGITQRILLPLASFKVLHDKPIEIRWKTSLEVISPFDL
jgi:hypothetical protein